MTVDEFKTKIDARMFNQCNLTVTNNAGNGITGLLFEGVTKCGCLFRIAGPSWQVVLDKLPQWVKKPS